jgi:hypothetical protein
LIAALQGGVVEDRFGQELLQLAVLVLEGSQPLGLRHLQAAVFGLPVVQRRFRDPVLARQIGRLRPSLMLAQHRDDLLFREPDTLHRRSLQQGRTLILRGGKTQWQVTTLKERTQTHRPATRSADLSGVFMIQMPRMPSSTGVLTYFAAWLVPWRPIFRVRSLASGLSLFVHRKDVIGRHIAKYREYEPRLTRWIAERLERASDGLFVNVGANVGWHSLHAARHASIEAVIAFEPSRCGGAIPSRDIPPQNDRAECGRRGESLRSARPLPTS